MEQEQQVEVRDTELEFSRCLISLMRGVVEQEAQPILWNSILENQARIMEYVEKIGLRLYIDKGIGYAYLRQVENENLPKLVNKHQLSYGLSMLLVMLRKSLGDYDAASGDSFLIIKKSDILLRLKGFFPQIANETKYVQEITRYIKRAVEMGFLVPVKREQYSSNSEENSKPSLQNEELYEVKELIRSFVTAAWLKGFEERISDYLAYANGEEPDDNGEAGDVDDNSAGTENVEHTDTEKEMEENKNEEAILDGLI